MKNKALNDDKHSSSELEDGNLEDGNQSLYAMVVTQ